MFIDFLLERLNLEIDYMSQHCPLMAAECEQGGGDVEQSEDIRAGKRILEAATAA